MSVKPSPSQSSGVTTSVAAFPQSTVIDAPAPSANHVYVCDDGSARTTPRSPRPSPTQLPGTTMSPLRPNRYPAGNGLAPELGSMYHVRSLLDARRATAMS